MKHWGGRQDDFTRQEDQIGPAEGRASGAIRKKLPPVHREGVGAREDVRGSEGGRQIDKGKLSNIIKGEGLRLIP